MSLSIQTNVNSMVAQENLRVNTEFQARTIQRLTSGYRINSSADDAAGLAVANKFRSDTAELTQGVRNANDAISQLQIIDGGANNIAKILDRLKTLATQAASGTFTGNRTTVNSEFQTLLSEIDRQADNVKLKTGGDYNTNLTAYIGGSGSANADAKVSVDLSTSAIDQIGLNLAGTTVVGGGSGFGASNTVRLDDTTLKFMAGSRTQTFTVDYMDTAGTMHNGVSVVVSGTNTATGLTGQQSVDAVNTALDGKGITNIRAQIGSNGSLAFAGTAAFQIKSATESGSAADPIVTAGTLYATNGGLTNTSVAYTALSQGTGTTAGGFSTNVVTFTVGSNSYVATLDGGNAGQVNSTTVFDGDTATNAAAGLNTFFQLQGLGIRAFTNAAGNNLTFEGTTAFTVSDTFTAGSAGTGGAPAVGVASGFGTLLALTMNAADASKSLTGKALSAVDAINTAVGLLGTVQGKVGSGQNQLRYGIALAQSQISNFASAESQIRDADVASEAANLTKAQVLQQASMAAMAQANSAPQAVLALLRG